MPSTEGEWAFLDVDLVRAAMAELHDYTVPSFFIAYLHFRERAIAQGSLSGVTWQWKMLTSSLALDGGGAKKPYYRPFNEHGTGSSNWINRNLAGSWAPRSTRPNGAARTVIDYTEGPDAPQGSVDLRPEHAKAALDNLLGGTRLPALAWVLWWMRDYGFQPGLPPDKQASNVINAFRTLFRLNDTPDVRLLNGTGDFDLLFESPGASVLAQPLLVEPK